MLFELDQIDIARELVLQVPLGDKVVLVGEAEDAEIDVRARTEAPLVRYGAKGNGGLVWNRQPFYCLSQAFEGS